MYELHVNRRVPVENIRSIKKTSGQGARVERGRPCPDEQIEGWGDAEETDTE